MTHPIEAILNNLGIKLNGPNPWDIQVHDKRFLNRVLFENSIGAGESYMDGWWDCEKLDELFYRICRNKGNKQFYSPLKIKLISLKNQFMNPQSRTRAEQVAQQHYNLNNHLFEYMLGKSMAYTCAYWKDANSLDEAQFNKYDLVCKKLKLKPGERVLEIGCGWGGLSKYMAENYKVEVVALDVGVGPLNYAKEHGKGLPIQYHLADYRDIDIYNPKKIQFDKIVSVGVLEHVGCKNYTTFLDLAADQLKEKGLFLLHSIGGNTSKNYCDPWINKYIFPNGQLPSLKQLAEAFENRFIVEDMQNFGAYYEKTLKGWYNNFNTHWLELKNHFDERFKRMTNYYLLSCAGSFKARDMQLWQFVLSKNGILNGYERV